MFKQIVGVDDDEFDRAACGGRDLMDARSARAACAVVELAGDPAGEMLGKLLAEMGADVVKVEPPGGSPSRSIGPFAEGHERRRPQPDASGTTTPNKRSVVLDDATPAGRAELFAPARRRRRLHHDACARRRPRAAGSRPTQLRRGLAAADRGVDHAVRAHRPVGRPAQLRPRRSRPRQPAQQLRLRRPLDPADPPGRRPGLPVGGQLRPDWR